MQAVYHIQRFPRVREIGAYRRGDSQEVCQYPPMNDNRTRLRLFVEYDLEDGHAVPANADQHNYLRKVMRRKDGDRVALFNGRHGEWLARIVYESKSRCAMIVERRLRMQRTPPDVWSLFAPVKATPMNNIARMSTELGVGRICPVLTEHTDVTRVNTARLRANAVEAAEQSTRLNVPMVDEPVDLVRLLADWDPASNAMGWQWTAGSGPDAAPYFRVFNPETQLEKFDGDGEYRARWIAEDATDPSETALSFFDAVPESWQLTADAPYPDRIVDLSEGRRRALAAYESREF